MFQKKKHVCILNFAYFSTGKVMLEAGTFARKAQKGLRAISEVTRYMAAVLNRPLLYWSYNNYLFTGFRTVKVILNICAYIRVI